MERLLSTLREAELEYELSQMKMRIQQLEMEKTPWAGTSAYSPRQASPVAIDHDTTILRVGAETRLSFHPVYGRVLEARSFEESDKPFFRLFREFKGPTPRHEQLEMINRTLVEFQKMLAVEWRNKEMLL